MRRGAWVLKYAVVTFGCRVNQADSLAIEEQLLAGGAEAVSSDRAIYELEARRLARPVYRRSWEPFARLELEGQAEIDPPALRFSPFLDGRGVHPQGFVHHLRVGTYAASQRARPR